MFQKARYNAVLTVATTLLEFVVNRLDLIFGNIIEYMEVLLLVFVETVV